MRDGAGARSEGGCDGGRHLPAGDGDGGGPVEQLEDLGGAALGLRELHRRGSDLADADDDLDLVRLEGRQLAELELLVSDHHEAHPQAHIQRAKGDQKPRDNRG